MRNLTPEEKYLIRLWKRLDRWQYDCRRLDPIRGWETDSVLYTQLEMLRCQSARLAIAIDRLHRK